MSKNVTLAKDFKRALFLMRRGASLGQRGSHDYGLQLNADAHEDARALPTFDSLDRAYGRYSDLPAQSARLH
jgi:hypothetical protein